MGCLCVCMYQYSPFSDEKFQQQCVVKNLGQFLIQFINHLFVKKRRLLIIPVNILHLSFSLVSILFNLYLKHNSLFFFFSSDLTGFVHSGTFHFRVKESNKVELPNIYFKCSAGAKEAVILKITRILASCLGEFQKKVQVCFL